MQSNSNIAYPIDQQSFASLISQIQQQNFSSYRLREIERACSHFSFDTVQCNHLLKLLVSDDDQVRATQLLFSRCTNAHDFGDVISVLAFSSSRNRAAENVLRGAAVRATGQLGPGCFKALLERMKNRTFSQEKMQELKLAVHGGGLFSCDQGKDLVKEIRGSKEEIQAAVLLHSCVVDVAHFGIILSALSWPSSKEEVQKRVRGHGASVAPRAEPAGVDDLMKRMQQGGYGTDKLKELKSALQNGVLLRCAQTKTLVREIGKEKDQREAIYAIYGKLLDAFNVGEIIAVMSNSVTRRSVAETLLTHMPHSTSPSTLTNADFDGLQSRLRRTYGASEKILEISLVVHSQGLLTSQQAGKLLLVFASSSDKAEIVRCIYPALVDPEKFRPPESMKMEMSERGVGQNTTTLKAAANTPPAHMDDKTFKQLLERMKKAFASTAKMNEVDLCLRADARFCSAQCKQLLAQLASIFDQEKLALKLYPVCTDPVNFGESLSVIRSSITKQNIVNKIKKL